MQTIQGSVDNYEVIILMDDPWKPCHLYVKLLSPVEMVLEDDEYPNALMLSANLTARLMLGNAIDFLEANNIPRTNPIWDLNHSDLWQRG